MKPLALRSIKISLLRFPIEVGIVPIMLFVFIDMLTRLVICPMVLGIELNWFPLMER